MRLAIAAILLGGLVLVSAPARAQSCVILPPGGEFELVAAHTMEVEARVRSVFENSGVEVLDARSVAARLDAVGAAHCDAIACAPTMLGVLHAAFAVGVTIERRSGVVQIQAVMIDPEGHQVSATADGTEDSIGQATEAALAQARARWSLREGSPVRVVGEPAGATITVDGAEWGVVPHEGRLSPGAHRVVVAAEGRAAETRSVDIPAASETIELSFTLAASGGGPDAVMLVLGASALAIGVAGLAVGIPNAVATEHCTAGCDGPASGRSLFVPSTDVGLGLTIAGAVVAAAGVVLVVVGALAGSGGASRATSWLGPNGVTLHF